MGSNSKKKTTMAKLNRERRLQERRLEKEARKEARKQAAHHLDRPSETLAGTTGESLASAPSHEDTE